MPGLPQWVFTTSTPRPHPTLYTRTHVHSPLMQPEGCLSKSKSNHVPLLLGTPPWFPISFSVKASCSVMSDSLPPFEPWPARLLCPWDFPDKNTGVGSHSLLQGIFVTQGLNSGLLHFRKILFHLSHQGNNLSFPRMVSSFLKVI